MMPWTGQTKVAFLVCRTLSTVAKPSTPVFIEGVRTPFLQSLTSFKTMMSYDLERKALLGLIQRTKVPRETVEYVVVGSVISEVKTSNVAREASLAAGLPAQLPAHTVTMACISSNQAITTCMEMIRSGHCAVTIAGGTESMSDVPIRIGRKLRRHLLDFNKSKKLDKATNLLMLLNPLNWSLEFPSATEFSSNETMGESGDRLATSFYVSRKEQDEFAVRSHTLAHEAFQNGKMTDIVPVVVPGLKKAVNADNGIRPSSMQQVSKLKPVFRRVIGSTTPANSSFLTDGASACLIMSEERALAEGYKPKAYLRDYVYVAQDPKDQLLLGPAFAIPKLLGRTKYKISDIDVFEIHEAFAGVVLANLKALDSDFFAKTWLGRSEKFGTIPMEKINLWGGSLSIGHPFGATGVRLVTHAVNRLIDTNGKLALVAACASGGLGHAMIIERYGS